MYQHAIEIDVAVCDVLGAFEDDLGLVRHGPERDIIDVQNENIFRQIVAKRYFPIEHIILQLDWEDIRRCKVFAKNKTLSEPLKKQMETNETTEDLKW